MLNGFSVYTSCVLLRSPFYNTSQHPGFDFSGADFNGQVPDARSFMGGVKHF
jgi:hypothetical protein